MGMEGDWSWECQWSIVSGCLGDCITLECSLDEAEDEDEDKPSKSKSTTPLLLQPPSPHSSSPCQITIHFPDKRQLRQIYVRSTARVYEIYCAPDHEYLCTVRCGLVVRDGRLLPIQHPTEDDWVEVNVLDTPNTTSQDLYEATAEIDDADPCISVTLRLLSLQNKRCVYVDEIYVFADPVDSTDSESHNENSSGSSLMAMLLPTVMQLSKTTGLGQLNALRKERQCDSEDGLETSPPSDPVIKTQLQGKANTSDPQELKLNEVKGSWVGPSQPVTLSQVAKMEAEPSQDTKMDNTPNHSTAPSQVTVTENNHGNSLGGNVERALEQLVPRMDRIEEICLGFQEKMVMPMSSIEARLQQVEKQLDALTKKLQNSALLSCSGISAPNASCIESDANSSDNCLDPTVTRESESDKKYLDTEVPYVSHDMSGSARTTQLLPGLVVTAPEFPDGEDEEGNAPGQETNVSKDRGQLSIDDALSSALANFLSSTTIESPKYTKSLTVKAPEFSNEDDEDHEGDNETTKNDSAHLTDSEELRDTQVLQASSIVSMESGEKGNTDSNDEQSEKATQEAEEYHQFSSAEGDLDEMNVKANILADENSETGFIDKFEDGNIDGQKSDSLSSNISDISNELLDNQNPCDYSTQEGTTARTELTVATEIPRKTFHENIIENVLGFSLASSVVDFETPLLDVKFISQRSAVAEHFLEDLDLLVETQVTTSSRDPAVKESSDDLSIKEQLNSYGDLSTEEQSNLISIDNGELVNPASDSHFAVDKYLCTSVTAPVNIQGDNQPPPEDHKRKRDQISSSSLI